MLLKGSVKNTQSIAIVILGFDVSAALAWFEMEKNSKIID
jgi:hypothetical protein